jgi:hypothetical protein
MTPSIIRRFARYHGLILERTDDASVVTEAYGIAPLARHVHSPAPNNWGAFRDACDKIIQSLTRIEDAEFAVQEALGWDESGIRHLALMSFAEDLLKLAGTDPAKWREVKDEEA